MHIDTNHLIMIHIYRQELYQSCLSDSCLTHNHNWNFGFYSLDDEAHFEEVVKSQGVIIGRDDVIGIGDVS